jgi:hypothetical protein
MTPPNPPRARPRLSVLSSSTYIPLQSQVSSLRAHVALFAHRQSQLAVRFSRRRNQRDADLHRMSAKTWTDFAASIALGYKSEFQDLLSRYEEPDNPDDKDDDSSSD